MPPAPGSAARSRLPLLPASTIHGVHRGHRWRHRVGLRQNGRALLLPRDVVLARGGAAILAQESADRVPSSTRRRQSGREIVVPGKWKNEYRHRRNAKKLTLCDRMSALSHRGKESCRS